MTAIEQLRPEWERLEHLAATLRRTRRGVGMRDEDKSRLRDLQSGVEQLRARHPWRDLTDRCGLSRLDQDILACAMGPEAEPRLGWAFNELQPGVGALFPTPALIHELYFLQGVEASRLRQRLDSRSPLQRGGLLCGAAGSYTPLRPTLRARAHLLGENHWVDAPPGTVEIPRGVGWDDLVVPPASRRALREFMLWMTHRDYVVGEWGARLEGGPVALFAGPSGTGKTFAARAVAGALDWPLYRVDLGLLVSKYVGETEKNLTALFEAAQDRPMVLLFDEADSLFGKRGEVREARDRWANMEVSHLLSRIESHRGPCILTSNLRDQLDPAFARRFQIVVEFPLPDVEARRELWQRLLPPRAPRATDCRPERLAEATTLTGGQIRNAALHAAFLAAGERMPITLTHAASAIWTELSKQGREVTAADLQGLAEHLPQERS